MKINRYITRGINESIPLDLQILLWHMVEEKDNQPQKLYHLLLIILAASLIIFFVN